ncbi:hypothetical protein KSP40_PGU012707 [Platanthera guangdongensis]|uniref:Uncharacterized protein n=1 Tax=Platanthera guangdongensis TaxID=2320717 RepID=A0ABR2N4B7_9ASPA
MVNLETESKESRKDQDSPKGQDACILMSEITSSAEKGAVFFIDMDRQTPVGTSPNQSLHRMATTGGVQEVAAFVMNCRV